MTTTPPGDVTVEQIAGWRSGLGALHARIGPRFARPEVRARAGRFLAALLGRVERKNGWQLAEAMGEATPDGVQRLLNGARWDADAVRDDLRGYVVEHLGDPRAILVIDETGFVKKGDKSAGVAPQYSGAAGGVATSQVGVFLAYATPRGRAFLDRALYLPKEWADDPARCRAAGIPDVGFATKPALAKALLGRAFAADVPAAWVTADAVYGQDGALRRWLEGEGRAYVLAVTGSSRQWVDTEALCGRVPIATLARKLPARSWRRIAVGDGTKGPRAFRWAAHPFPGGPAGWAKWVLFRRSLADPADITYYRAFGPEGTTVDELARVAASRWAIEEGFQRLKGDVGLDQYEVRRWAAWHRHITLCLLAHAYLEVTRAAADVAGEAAAGVDGGKGGAVACCV